MPPLGKVFMFEIKDKDDVEFPFTMDFKSPKADFFLGRPQDK